MPSYRKLPSGLWRVTVRLPSGKRITETSKLKKNVQAWATDQEAKIAQGHKINPRAGRITFLEWHDRWWSARMVEDDTRRTDSYLVRGHIAPHWNEWRLGDIGRIDIQSWVRTLQKAGVGVFAIRRSYSLLQAILGDAVIEGLIPVSPCQKIELPATPPKLPVWFTRAQVDAIVAELAQANGVMTELMVYTGLRWGEASGTSGADRADETGNPVDWLRGRIKVRGVINGQSGQWKAYPKNSSSRREVPVPPHVLELLGQLLVGRARDGWMFVGERYQLSDARQDGVVKGSRWRDQWYRAIDAANAQIAEGNRGVPEDQRAPLVPRYRPHTCRHTAASWLVQSGVPLYDIQKLLGHASFQTTQRYAHLVPDAYEAVEVAWSKIIAHQGCIAPDRRSEGTG